MADHDDAPLSSYSDPFYDRLDAFARQFKRNWWMFALAFLIVAAGAIWLRLQWSSDPNAATAAACVRAEEEQDEAKRESAWKAIADDAKAPAFYRAKASIELTQLLLAKGDTVQSKDRASRAESLARDAGDDDILLAASLSRAAVALQAGDNTGALDLYEKAAKGAGARFPVRKLDAELGAVRALHALGKTEEAISRLEPLTTRKERGAEDLIRLSQLVYWQLKRELAEKSQPKPTAAAPAPSAPAAAPAAPAPATK